MAPNALRYWRHALAFSLGLGLCGTAVLPARAGSPSLSAVPGLEESEAATGDQPGNDMFGRTMASSPRSFAADGFLRAIGPHRFVFPRDHGPHPGFRTEWWYYTGNLAATDGRRFGFELTLFRIALRPPPAASSAVPSSGAPDTEPVSEPVSAWAMRDVYMGHFAITDVAGQRFYHAQRFSRAALGLAGARPEAVPGPLSGSVSDSTSTAASAPFAVWLDDWRVARQPLAPRRSAADASCLATVRQAGVDASHCLALRLQASVPAAVAGPADKAAVPARPFGLTLELHARKPLVLQGDAGLSQKGPAPGDASYYYSFTRLAASGTVKLGDSAFTVHGLAWMDREWSTSALGAGQVGWDWFALQLDDGRDLMYYRLRRADGRRDPHSAGVWVDPHGKVQRLGATAVAIHVSAHWRSPHTGIRYPAAWQLQFSDGTMLRVRPLLADQELYATAVRYWEGAVEVEGHDAMGKPVHGRGYVELAGYGVQAHGGMP